MIGTVSIFLMLAYQSIVLRPWCNQDPYCYNVWASPVLECCSDVETEKADLTRHTSPLTRPNLST